MPDDSGLNVAPWVINAIVILVTVVWSVSFISDIYVTDYDPPGEVNIAFTAIITGALGINHLNQRDRNNRMRAGDRDRDGYNE